MIGSVELGFHVRRASNAGERRRQALPLTLPDDSSDR
jgi:hypothetical protein